MSPPACKVESQRKEGKNVEKAREKMKTHLSESLSSGESDSTRATGDSRDLALHREEAVNARISFVLDGRGGGTVDALEDAVGELRRRTREGTVGRPGPEGSSVSTPLQNGGRGEETHILFSS
jgi:hypothetical protein